MSKQTSPQPVGPVTDTEVEQHLRQFFEHNYDLLRQEGGHALTEGARRQALEQTLLYWRKLKAIATTVTETEVKLALPGQITPQGRPFVIEGIVDIVRRGDEVRMYDLKTHDEQEVRAERELYEDQLNVYAHIWKGIRRQNLDGTAIIATRLPPELRDALRSGDSDAIRAAVQAWEPVVDLPFDENQVARTIADFGKCVDAIEEGEFVPPPPEQLGRTRRRQKQKSNAASSSSASEPTFARIHCQNCDARFVCPSYRVFQKREAKASRPTGKADRQAHIEVQERELDAWIDENLDEL